MTIYSIPISVKGIVWEGNAVWLRKNERNEWELPGGKLDRGEQPEAAVVRELQEELGFMIKINQLITAHVFTIEKSLDETNGVFILIYSCNLLGKTGQMEIIGEAGKATFQKFTKDEIKILPMPEFYKEAILKTVPQ